MPNYASLLLSENSNGKLDKAIKYGSIVVPAALYVVRKYKESQANKKYTVTVANDSDLYYVLESWLQDKFPEVEQRHISVAVKNRELTSFFDQEMVQIIMFGEHPIEVSFKQNAKKKRSGAEGEADVVSDGPDGYFIDLKKRKITLVAKDMEGKKAVLAQLKEFSKKFEAGTWLRMANQWGDWSTIGRIPVRPMSSIILPDNQAERILTDAKLFRQSKEKYDTLGIPWHRGYLFHGPPGSGKTSLAKMLAYELGMNLYYAPLSAIENDTKLSEMICRIGDNSILLLEDIDIVHAAKERNDDGKGISLSGLLNALDGVVTPSGMITIMTTNNKDVLDPALIRAGRVDVDEEIGYLTDEQLNKLCLFLLNKDLDLCLCGNKITSSEVVEIFKVNLHDNDAIINQLQSRWG